MRFKPFRPPDWGLRSAPSSLDFNRADIDIVARNAFRQTPLYQDFINVTFDTVLGKAVAATGADERADLVRQLVAIRPVSPAREKTAQCAMSFFGSSPDHEKVALGLNDEDARKFIFHWAKDSPLSAAIELALSKDVSVAGWLYTTAGAMFLYAVDWVH